MQGNLAKIDGEVFR